MSCPTPTMLQRRKKTAKQPESNKAVSLKATRNQTIPNRGCYCLSHDVKESTEGTRSWSSAMGSLSMERKLSWKLQLTASTSPIDFCGMFGTSWFDGVTSVCSLIQATPITSTASWERNVFLSICRFYLLFICSLYFCLLLLQNPKHSCGWPSFTRWFRMRGQCPSTGMLPKPKNTLHWPFPLPPRIVCNVPGRGSLSV